MKRLWISGLAAALFAGAPFVPESRDVARAACDPAPPGLVSSWQAEGDYTDCQGLHNGTQVGSVPFAPGKIGQAFSFSTNPNNYVDLGNPAGLKFTDAITISAWIYPTAAPAPGNLRAILVKWAQVFTGPASGRDSYGLWTENGTGGTLRIFGAVNLDPGGGGAIEPHVSGGTVPLNAWSHVAMTFYRSPTDVNMVAYVNCTAVASLAVGDYPIVASDKRVLIGREDSGQTRPFAGLIDQVRVFDRALSAAEISQLARAGDPTICGTFSHTFGCPPDTVVDAKGIANRIFTITNTGTAADDYEYSVTDDAGWITPVSGTTGVLAPNATFSIKVTATGDADCNPGSDVLTFAVRPVGDPNPPQTCTTLLTCSPVSITKTLESDRNPSLCGEKVTFTNRLSQADATGTVTFFDGADPIGTEPVAGGVATLSIATLAVGTRSITASYSGDGGHLPTTSNKIEQVVNPIPTSTALASDPNPSNCGSKVTFTATVEPPAASGEVIFLDDGVPIGSGTLVDGVATLSIATLSRGTHPIAATYQGEGCHDGSTSNQVEQVVNFVATTTTTLTGDPNPSMCGQKVTLTARVDPPTATGQVLLSGDASGSAPLVDGVATFSLVLGTGARSFNATYEGDGCHEGSTSSKLEQVTVPATTTTSLTSSPNPSSCPDKVTLTATVDPLSATGEVNFFDGALPIGSGTLVNGVATLSIPEPAMGLHSYTAVYKGDGCRAASLSNPVTHDHDCPTPTLLAMFRAEPLTAAVELRWQFSDPTAVNEIRVERSVNQLGPWMAVTVAIRDENGVAVAVDRTVEPGQSYWYRLVALSESGSALQFGPLSATAGRAIDRFELGTPWPNPSRGNIRVDFAVARESSIRLGIVDVLGREVAVLAHGVHGAGRYQAVWSGETSRGPAPAGLYFVRYQHSGKVLIERLVLAR